MRKIVSLLMLFICLHSSNVLAQECIDYQTVLTIFNASCMENCHANGLGGTFLTYEELLSTSASCGDIPYLNIGDGASSYLYDKINDDGETACGSNMPFGIPLSIEDQETIKQWIDEGAIENQVLGCTNPDANNYNPTANCDDGTCDFIVVDPGCTDSNACNYDPNATIDNGLCDYGIPECPEPCNAIQGCTDMMAGNYNPNANCDDGTCEFINSDGCTDSLACNYSPTATIDGLCEYGIPECPEPCNAIQGCTNQEAVNYNPNANCDDGSCQYAGCTDTLACNFDANVSIENGSCTYGLDFCEDPCNAIVGCTNSEALNYNPEANCDDGTCVTTGTEGCTNACADNYNPDATIDDGSCILPDCDDMCILTIDSLNTTTCECENIAPSVDDDCDLTLDSFDFVNCTVVNTPPTDVDDGCNLTEDSYDAENCVIVNAPPSCDDDNPNTFDNFDPVNCLCINSDTPLTGCTDPCAINYDSTASEDDGSCTYPDCDDGCLLTVDTFDSDSCACVNSTPLVNDFCDLTVDSFDPITCTITNIADCDDGNACTEDSFDVGACACINAPLAECGCQGFSVSTEIVCEDGLYYVSVKVDGIYDDYSVISTTGTFSYKLIDSTFVDGPFELNEAYEYTIYLLNEPECMETISGNGNTCDPTSALNDLDAWEISVYPIPLQNQLFVELTTDAPQNGNLYLYDLSGKILLEQTVDLGVGKQQIVLNTQTLGSGIYLLSLVTEEGSQNFKLLK